MLVIRLVENERYGFIDDMGKVRPVTFLKREYGEMYSFYDGIIPTDEEIIRETPEIRNLPEETQKLVIEKRREELKKINAFPLDKYEVEEKVIEPDKAEDIEKDEEAASIEFVMIDPTLPKHMTVLVTEEEKKELLDIQEKMGYSGDLIRDTQEGHHDTREKEVNDTMKFVRDILVDACCRGEQLDQRPTDYAEVRHKLEEQVANAVTTRQEGEVKKLICQVDFAAATETIVIGEDYVMRSGEYERAYSRAYGVEIETVRKHVSESISYVVEQEKLVGRSLDDFENQRNHFYRKHTKFDDYNVPFIDSIDMEPARDIEDTYRNGYAMTLYKLTDGSHNSSKQMRDGIRKLVDQIDRMRGEVSGISTYDTEKTMQFMQGLKRLAMKKYTLLPWDVESDEIPDVAAGSEKDREGGWSFFKKRI
ncbi:MAG: hypothetical protein SPL57_07390 [Lachnospiraceae bacterium]|nr:hypothetical protein [Lachnospiraceae bacterium]